MCDDAACVSFSRTACDVCLGRVDATGKCIEPEDGATATHGGVVACGAGQNAAAGVCAGCDALHAGCTLCDGPACVVCAAETIAENGRDGAGTCARRRTGLCAERARRWRCT